MANRLQPPPRDKLLAWVTQNPDAVVDYLLRVRQLEALQVVIVVEGVQKKGVVQFSGENAVIEVKVS